MDFDIRTLDAGDVDELDRLMKANSATLGFLPREALLHYLNQEWVLGVMKGDGRLAAYILFANRATDVRVAQLCVSEDSRGQGLAKNLVDRLSTESRNRELLSLELHCRRDFAANDMWPELGFIPWGDKPGRAKSGTTLTLWRRKLAPSPQRDLLQDEVGHGETDVVVDALVLFDLETPDDDETAGPSKALFSDFFVDELNIKITDETLVEIDRDDDNERRQKSRQKALSFPQVDYDERAFRRITAVLEKNFPAKSENDRSDIAQLAKAAASNAAFFATRDGKVLNSSKLIEELTGLQALSPARIIVEINDRMTGPRAPERVSGFNVEWRRPSAPELNLFESQGFLREGERKRTFDRKFEAYLSQSNRLTCEILRFGGTAVAVRAFSVDEGKVMNVHLGRVTHRVHDRLAEPYFVMDLILKAARIGAEVIVMEHSEVVGRLGLHFKDNGFIEHDGALIRFFLPAILRRHEALSRMESLRPGSASVFSDLEPGRLERSCSPLCFADFEQSFLIIPIRPGYAMNIVDFMLSADDLFGGDPSRLLRPDNVYYRSAGTFSNLKPPARILWYVSGDGRIAATSHLDDVEIGPAKEIFRKYHKRGTLDRRAVLQISEGDPEGRVMALSFSDTNPFPRSVPLEEIKEVYRSLGDGSEFAPITIRNVTAKIFHELFKRGHREGPLS